jgi:hypothetical protein
LEEEMMKKVFAMVLLLCGLSYGQTDQTCTVTLQTVNPGVPVYCLGNQGSKNPIWTINVDQSGTGVVTSVFDNVESYTSASKITMNMQKLKFFYWEGTFYDKADAWQFHIVLQYFSGSGGLVLVAAGAGSLAPPVHARTSTKHRR